jgi:hypothetical protein
MSRMVKEKKSFLGALITSSGKLDPFAHVFEQNFTLTNKELSIVQRIQQ